MNRFKFHGCIEVNTLTQWCTFVCDFSKVWLFFYLHLCMYIVNVHCTWYTNVHTFDLAVTNYLLQCSSRVYKTCFIKLFSCDKICTIKCERKKNGAHRVANDIISMNMNLTTQKGLGYWVRIYHSHVYHRIVSIKGVSLHIICQYVSLNRNASGYAYICIYARDAVKMCAVINFHNLNRRFHAIPFYLGYCVGIVYFMQNRIMRCVRQW